MERGLPIDGAYQSGAGKSEQCVGSDPSGHPVSPYVVS
jgi:hypothetical protein